MPRSGRDGWATTPNRRRDAVIERRRLVGSLEPDVVRRDPTAHRPCSGDPSNARPLRRGRAQAKEPQVKMVEIKLSQGAKPGHGGVLPGAKVDRARGKLTGNFAESGRSAAISASGQRMNSMASSRIPYATEQGISKRVSGNFFEEQGILIVR